MNYTYQSFNIRSKSKIRPYYDLVANIAAEEMGHIELVANTVNLLLDQTEASGRVTLQVDSLLRRRIGRMWSLLQRVFWGRFPRWMASALGDSVGRA